MQEELVSVVIITYNNEKYIKECIKSVEKQTYKKIEIIVVDDGSTDNTFKIVEELAKKNKNIHYIKRKENKGTMNTRKEGYNKSSGKYIFFLDSDDWIEENAIEILYKNLKEDNVDMVKCNFKKYINSKFKKIDNQVDKEIILEKKDFEPILYDYIYKTIYCNSMCGQLVKRELLEDINKVEDGTIYGEDIQSNLYLFSKINSIKMINNELYIYRCNEASITNIVNEKKINDLIKTFDKLFDFIEETNIIKKQEYKKILAEKLYNHIVLIAIQLSTQKNKQPIIDISEKIINKSSNILKNYENTNYFNKDILYKFALKLLIKRKYNMLYKYILYIYLPIKKIYKTIRK